MLLLPLILAAFATLTGLGKRDAIRDDLELRSQAALINSGVSGAQVSVDGRDVTVSGVPADQQDAANDAVRDLDGVRTVSVNADGAQATQAQASPLDIAVAADKITLTGSVPDTATKTALVDAANSKANGRPVIDQLAVPNGAKPSIDGAGVAALIGTLGTSGINARVDGAGVTLTGVVSDDAARAGIETQVRAGLPGQNVINQLVVAPPAPPPPTFDKAGLQQRINDFIAGQAITFTPDTATLTADGSKTVAQVADALKSAAEAAVESDGHVAKTPGPSPNAQPLSEQRAQAVRSRLIDAGIAPERLTAKGFAAERPIAPNNTATGQAANRRVEIIVL